MNINQGYAQDVQTLKTQVLLLKDLVHQKKADFSMVSKYTRPRSWTVNKYYRIIHIFGSYIFSNHTRSLGKAQTQDKSRKVFFGQTHSMEYISALLIFSCLCLIKITSLFSVYLIILWFLINVFGVLILQAKDKGSWKADFSIISNWTRLGS